jgi:hypothetical protein
MALPFCRQDNGPGRWTEIWAAHDDWLVAAIAELLSEKPFTSCKMICRQLKFPKTTCLRVLNEELGLTKFDLRWVPYTPDANHFQATVWLWWRSARRATRDLTWSRIDRIEPSVYFISLGPPNNDILNIRWFSWNLPFWEWKCDMRKQLISLYRGLESPSPRWFCFKRGGVLWCRDTANAGTTRSCSKVCAFPHLHCSSDRQLTWKLTFHQI